MPIVNKGREFTEMLGDKTPNIPLTRDEFNVPPELVSQASVQSRPYIPGDVKLSAEKVTSVLNALPIGSNQLYYGEVSTKANTILTCTLITYTVPQGFIMVLREFSFAQSSRDATVYGDQDVKLSFLENGSVLPGLSEITIDDPFCDLSPYAVINEKSIFTITYTGTASNDVTHFSSLIKGELIPVKAGSADSVPIKG